MAYSDTDVQFQAFLIFKWPIAYKIEVHSMKNASIIWTEREIQFWNKWNFVEKKTGSAACLKNAVNFFVA